MSAGRPCRIEPQPCWAELILRPRSVQAALGNLIIRDCHSPRGCGAHRIDDDRLIIAAEMAGHRFSSGPGVLSVLQALCIRKGHARVRLSRNSACKQASSLADIIVASSDVHGVPLMIRPITSATPTAALPRAIAQTSLRKMECGPAAASEPWAPRGRRGSSRYRYQPCIFRPPDTCRHGCDCVCKSVFWAFGSSVR